MKNSVKKYEYGSPIAFLIITFLLPLVSFLLQVQINNNSLKFILYGVEAASPTIAVMVVICKTNGVKNFLKKNFNKNHLMLAFILPVIIVCSTMFLAKWIACAICDKQFVLGNISLSQFIIIAWSFIAEEFGWRGYLLPLLKIRLKKVWLAPFVVGIVWCFWHYHYFLMKGMEVPFLLFFLSCIIESYIYDYLLNWTYENLVSAMMYHFLWNLFLHLFLINPSDNNGNLIPYVLLVVLELFSLGVFFLINKVTKDRHIKLL